MLESHMKIPLSSNQIFWNRLFSTVLDTLPDIFCPVCPILSILLKRVQYYCDFDKSLEISVDVEFRCHCPASFHFLIFSLLTELKWVSIGVLKIPLSSNQIFWTRSFSTMLDTLPVFSALFATFSFPYSMNFGPW